MKTNKLYIIRYTAFAFALGIMTLIFVMSAQDATRSSAASGGFIRSIAPLIKSNFHQLSSPEQEGFIESLQYIVRKAAHFNVYALLAVLVATGVFTFDRLKNVFPQTVPENILSVYHYTILIVKSQLILKN